MLQRCYHRCHHRCYGESTIQPSSWHSGLRLPLRSTNAYQTCDWLSHWVYTASPPAIGSHAFNPLVGTQGCGCHYGPPMLIKPVIGYHAKYILPPLL
eukprot:4190312-Pyramimonas_sp.AAC.1